MLRQSNCAVLCALPRQRCKVVSSPPTLPGTNQQPYLRAFWSRLHCFTRPEPSQASCRLAPSVVPGARHCALPATMAQLQAQPQRTVSATESIELIRCLLRVSVFHVTALRGLFPESYYREITMRNLEGMTIKVLNPLDDESKRLIDWIDGGVFDAVKKGYLKTLVFGISSNSEGTDLMEEYVYNFSYGPNGALAMKVDKMETDAKGLKTAAGSGEVEVPSNSSNQLTVVKYQVTRLMRMLVGLCRTLEKVPKERYLFCRLTYYDHTPDDFEPHFFRSVDAEEVARLSRFARRPFSMQVGALVTDHHQCSLRVKSILDACDDEGEGDEEEQQASGQLDLDPDPLEMPKAAQEEAPKDPPSISERPGAKDVPPRLRAQDDLNDLMTEPQGPPPLPSPVAGDKAAGGQRPELEGEAGDNFAETGGAGNAMSDDDVTECPDAVQAKAAKAGNALADDLDSLAMDQTKKARPPPSENFPPKSKPEESDTTMSPARDAAGGKRKHKHMDDASEGVPPHLPSQNPPAVYYEASQHSGRQAFKRSKASVVTDPIHQTGAKKKAPALPVKAAKSTPGTGRTRMSRMK